MGDFQIIEMGARGKVRGGESQVKGGESQVKYRKSQVTPKNCKQTAKICELDISLSLLFTSNRHKNSFKLSPIGKSPNNLVYIQIKTLQRIEGFPPKSYYFTVSGTLNPKPSATFVPYSGSAL